MLDQDFRNDFNKRRYVTWPLVASLAYLSMPMTTVIQEPQGPALNLIMSLLPTVLWIGIGLLAAFLANKFGKGWTGTRSPRDLPKDQMIGFVVLVLLLLVVKSIDPWSLLSLFAGLPAMLIIKGSAERSKVAAEIMARRAEAIYSEREE